MFGSSAVTKETIHEYLIVVGEPAEEDDTSDSRGRNVEKDLTVSEDGNVSPTVAPGTILREL